MTASSQDKKSSGIVADGQNRAVEANRVEIEKRIHEKYADELASATGFFRRWTVRRKIRREIEEELEKNAPR
ncbi:MAG: hypothetical protein IIC02_13010, partial [Planctomycetes bacterium]|nr:hypothetical protein [Planctomycetota bacterium]